METKSLALGVFFLKTRMPGAGQWHSAKERVGAKSSGFGSQQLPHVLSCVTLDMPLTLSEPYLNTRVLVPSLWWYYEY